MSETLNGVGPTSIATYNIMDRPISITASSGIITSNIFDALGRVTTNIVAGQLTNNFVYSAKGLIQTLDGVGNSTFFSNNPAGWLIFRTNANTEVTQYQYDNAGNVTNLTDGKLQHTTFQFDQFGRLITNLDNALSNIVQLTYDADGRVQTRTTPAKGTITYTYDPVGRIRTNSYPSNPMVVFGYDLDGRLTSLADGLGTTTFAYSNSGQLVSEDGPWASDALAFTYQARLRNSLSLQQPSADPWIQTYAYDTAHRLTNVTSPAGVFGYQYHPGFGTGGPYSSPLWQTLTLPNTAFITNSFDSAARLLTTALETSGATILNSHSYTYDLDSRRTQQTRTKGDYVSYKFDGIGQMTNAVGWESGGVTNRLQEQMGYVYDAAHNLNYRTNNALVQTFAVNGDNELTTISRNSTAALTVSGTTGATATNVTVNGTAAVLYGDNTFAEAGFTPVNGANTYTAIGKDNVGRISTNAITVNLPSSASYTYDFNGNLSGDGTRTFTYDDENQLIQITVTGVWQTQFIYDGLMRRRFRKEFAWSGAWVETNEVHYIYDGYVVIQERDVNNLPQASYTRGLDLSRSLQGANGIGGLLAFSQVSTLNQQHFYYHADANGNVTSVVNAQQIVVAKYLYDSFGVILAQSGPTANANHYCFSSMEFLANSGLYGYLRRFYDPNFQRWLNRDPLADTPGLKLNGRKMPVESLFGPNLYTFVYNNPASYVDPNGLWGIAFGNNSGSSYFNIGWGNPSLYFSPDAGNGVGQSAATTADGLNPFGNPFANNGVL